MKLELDEAIENLEYLVSDSCTDTQFDYIEEIEIATKALEKQIPKKPNYEGDGYYNGQPVYDTWICPCCEEMYEVDYDEYDYCPNCGQKIDWSDENETD